MKMSAEQIFMKYTQGNSHLSGIKRMSWFLRCFQFAFRTFSVLFWVSFRKPANDRMINPYSSLLHSIWDKMCVQTQHFNQFYNPFLKDFSYQHNCYCRSIAWADVFRYHLSILEVAMVLIDKLISMYVKRENFCLKVSKL